MRLNAKPETVYTVSGAQNIVDYLMSDPSQDWFYEVEIVSKGGFLSGLFFNRTKAYVKATGEDGIVAGYL